MTFHGIVMINLMAAVLVLWVLNLVRRGRLYVGYGVLFIVVSVSTAVIVSVPELLMLVTRLVGAVYPVSALTLLAFGFIAFMFVYILTQLTIVSNRLATVVQELALRQAKEQAETVNRSQ